MSTIDVPAPGDPILDTWGESVANAINDHQFDYFGGPRIAALGAKHSSASTYYTSPVNSGAVIPFAVGGALVLTGYGLQIIDITQVRNAYFALYRDDGSPAWPRVTGSEAYRSWSPASATYYSFPLTGSDIVLTPGYYWLAVWTTGAYGLSIGAEDVLGGSAAAINGVWAAGAVTPGASLDASAITGSAYVRNAFLECEIAGGGSF